jgi:hypothetical protein
MARLSNRMRHALYAPVTEEDELLLATITNPGWAAPLRICNFGLEYEVVEETGLLRTFTTSGGMEYAAAIVSGLFADDIDGDMPGVPLVIDNVNFDATALTEDSLVDATVDLVRVAKSDPDEILEEQRGFMVGRDVEASRETVTLSLSLDPGEQFEPSVSYRMNKDNAPGMWL